MRRAFHPAGTEHHSLERTLGNERTAPRSALLFVLAAFVLLLRLPYFNNPAAGLDDQFYLAFADKWINDGLIPYVDIWDRKPLGIFAIYAAALLLFKNAILGYQIIAALFVIATGAVLMSIGRMLGEARTSFPMAMIYVAALMLMDGGGGQTAVFYNLPVTAAAAIILRLTLGDTVPSHRSAVLGALTACLLFGLAIQIKYICALESAALSLYLLAAFYRRRIFHLPGLMMLAGGMIFCGLLPTVLVGGAYVVIGHWNEFYSANFVSIFQKALWSVSTKEYVRRFTESIRRMIIFLPFAIYAVRMVMLESRPRTERSLVLVGTIWFVVAFIGALLLGNPTTLYFLPTLPPLALLASMGLLRLADRTDVVGRVLSVLQGQFYGYGALVAMLIVPTYWSFAIEHREALQKGEPEGVYALGEYLRTHKTNACPFVFNRLPILYYLADACAPSIYLFPNHLMEVGEVRTADGERLKELSRVLDEGPPLIFIQRPHTLDTDFEAISMLEQVLHDRYVLVVKQPLTAKHPRNRQLYYIYARKDLFEKWNQDVAQARRDVANSRQATYHGSR